MIEDGLEYIGHQRSAAVGRLDVLLVDSGKSLVVAELKIIQDDGMLLQALDYYDYVSSHVEAFARLYQKSGIDPTQQVRLFLIAPSFSQALINRCKWLDVPISLFTCSCLKFPNEGDLVPIFWEQTIPTPPEVVEVTRFEDHLQYITDPQARARAAALLEQIRNWRPDRIAVDPIKYAISIKISGRVFAYFHPRRKHFLLSTYDSQEQWMDHPIHSDEDLEKVLPLVRAAMERRA